MSLSHPPQSIIDVEQALVFTGGDTEMLVSIAELFAEEGPRQMAEIKQQMDAANRGGIQRAAHQLRGSVVLFGASKASLATLRIEEIAWSGDLSQARKWFAPRVRVKSENGSSEEVELASYRAAKDPKQLQSQIVQAIASGVSSRNVQEIKPNSPGVKKSSASRLWQEAGSKFVEALRGKDLTQTTWCALMLDGIHLSSEQTAVVALGIESEGRKHVLDSTLSSSESLEVSRELMGRIVSRGSSCEHRLYVVLDGSDALRGAVKEFFADAVVQR